MSLNQTIALFKSLAMYLVVPLLLMGTLSCDVFDTDNDSILIEDETDQEDYEITFGYMGISFVQQVIDMGEPADTVTLEAFTAEAEHIKDFLMEVDENVLITRIMPEFEPADTLRVTADGDTLYSIDWSLVYQFHLSKMIPNIEVKDHLEQDPLIKFVDPPYWIAPD